MSLKKFNLTFQDLKSLENDDGEEEEEEEKEEEEEEEDAEKELKEISKSQQDLTTISSATSISTDEKFNSFLTVPDSSPEPNNKTTVLGLFLFFKLNFRQMIYSSNST